MKSENSNPFVLPGFGQAGDLSQNPLLASMEMMRQAWQGLATSGILAQPPVSSTLATEDLDRRISDLRAVENWLRINMSMLTSSIQALEVQRATIATLRSFANIPGVPADSGDNPSPLEVALGIKPSGQARIKTPPEVNPEANEGSAGAGDGAGSKGSGPGGDPAALSDAAQGWWNMLQKQFDTLAAATVAGMQATPMGTPDDGKKAGAATRKRPAKSGGKSAASDAAAAKRAAGKKVASTTKAARTARKSAASRLAGRKT